MKFPVYINEHGQPEMADATKNLWRKMLKQNAGKHGWFHFEERKKVRTLEQNSYYWLYLQVISNETGHDRATLHDFFKKKFLSKGVKEMYGQKIIETQSTAELSKAEFTEYIHQIEMLTGIPAPDTSVFEYAPTNE